MVTHLIILLFFYKFLENSDFLLSIQIQTLLSAIIFQKALATKHIFI